MKLNSILITGILICLMITIAIQGYNQGLNAQITPVSNDLIFSDYQSDYKLPRSTDYRTERIMDNGIEYWFIYLETGNGRMIIEYKNTYIDGQFISSEEWKDSFIMNFGGIK